MAARHSTSDEIHVRVTRHGNRKFLVMYYDDPLTGKRVQRSTKKTGRRDAEREAAKWEADLRTGRYKPQSRITWAEFRDRYENERLSQLSDKTFKATMTAFNHFESMVGPDRLCKVNTATVQRFAIALRNHRFRRIVEPGTKDREAVVEQRPMSDASVAAHLRHLRAALGWAVRQGLLAELPDFDMPKTHRGQRMMRGRAITAEEFERMLAATPDVRPEDFSSWRFYLRGLWHSGLRLEESVGLSWDEDEPFCVDLSGRHPRFRIYAEAQKGRRDQYLSMTPDFAELILGQTPESERSGQVFKLLNPAGRQMVPHRVGRIVSEIGRKAGVVVDKAARKFASAHDLRRAFGTRWSFKLAPATLQKLMRHSSIETTMRYYVDQDADEIATELWSTTTETKWNRHRQFEW